MIFEYKVIDAEQIDLIRTMWEKLNAHHSGISVHFSEALLSRHFDERKSQLLADGRKVHVLLASIPGVQNPIAYCVASLSPDGNGEIDSMFIEEEYRGSGIGTEFMRRALTWLDKCGAATKSVGVLFENDPALRFYAHFGFYPRTVNLIQKKT